MKLKEFIEKKLYDRGIYYSILNKYTLLRAAKPRILLSNIRYLRNNSKKRWPIPPLNLIFLVTGTIDISSFVESGRLSKQLIVDVLKKNNVYIDNLQKILDFGCGCGRVISHWGILKNTEIYGTDYNPLLIKWCKTNINFAKFNTNQLEPPLIYDDEKFDLVYALSVFTHLPESLQLLWINEINRILRPGGYLLFTTHGANKVKQLTKVEKEKYLANQLVIQGSIVGSNYLGVIHPVNYVTEKLGAGFDIIDHIPGENNKHPFQDVFLFKKPL
jgi:SAM-dependent methyltransferase